jgi:hypothetical protein
MPCRRGGCCGCARVFIVVAAGALTGMALTCKRPDDRAAALRAGGFLDRLGTLLGAGARRGYARNCRCSAGRSGWVLALRRPSGPPARSLGSQQRALRPVGAGTISAARCGGGDHCAIPTGWRCTAKSANIFCALHRPRRLHQAEPRDRRRKPCAFLLNRYLDMLSGGRARNMAARSTSSSAMRWSPSGARRSARPDDAEQRRRGRARHVSRRASGIAGTLPPKACRRSECTRVGLHVGDAIVGNFGGEGRIQYTALGDSMNLAARLESANKQLKTTVLVSETVVARVGGGQFWPMGRVSVRGRSTPIMVYEPVKKDSERDVTRLTALVTRFDQGDTQALEELEIFSAERPDDVALACLVQRLRHAGAGGSFVLD